MKSGVPCVAPKERSMVGTAGLIRKKLKLFTHPFGALTLRFRVQFAYANFRTFYGSNPAIVIIIYDVANKSCRSFSEGGWLGRQDSNLRMTGSKPVALPLGYVPVIGKRITAIFTAKC